MASGIFAVLDDIAVLMDDVAVAAKVATKKTVGILGDDLAVNAEKATGFVSSREIPVLWAITKGSLVNKVIIVPIVLILNYLLPSAITVILLLGGLYLAYEGAEKIVEYFFHKKEAKTTENFTAAEPVNEKTKIKSAITTDFILSIEIVIIALGAVLTQPLATQIGAVVLVALLATFGVYGIVAVIVRMDDVGYKLIKKNNNKGILAQMGKILVKLLPIIIRTLAVVGTIALLLVAGGIFSHNITFLHDVLPSIPAIVKEFILGLGIGLLTVGITLLFKAIIKK
ncbi:DUF808 domain-containing protein [Flavobacterium agricola]|uniref:DUF808 domain-containing protein n=1 Tax=Flavobacterium agricola TaxID=2870839 RepID=A0ABY6M354_9FLAO|nr:DUF808 domain-containing protein [Flavobacterium agricola]UYW01885.1 DUF808 domain-containing protein [Flavobacterium agricola]